MSLLRNEFFPPNLYENYVLKKIHVLLARHGNMANLLTMIIGEIFKPSETPFSFLSSQEQNGPNLINRDTENGLLYKAWSK
jgi:hypothetical protein